MLSLMMILTYKISRKGGKEMEYYIIYTNGIVVECCSKRSDNDNERIEKYVNAMNKNK